MTWGEIFRRSGRLQLRLPIGAAVEQTQDDDLFRRDGEGDGHAPPKTDDPETFQHVGAEGAAFRARSRSRQKASSRSM